MVSASASASVAAVEQEDDTEAVRVPIVVRAGIAGVGKATPKRVVTNFDLEKIVDTSDEWIFSRTGIRERRVSDADMATSDLAIEASRAALISAGIEASELDLILCATTSGDYIWPSTACVVQQALGAKKAAAFDLAAACAGFCYGLTTAAAYIQSGLMRNILLIGADTLTKQLNWQDRSTCILFGDGAGAVVLNRVGVDEGVLASTLGADGSGIESVWIPAGGTRTPTTETVLADHLNCISMRGQDVYKFAVKTVPDTILQALSRACLRTSDVSLLVMHQANLRIIDAVSKRLDIPMERVFVNLEKYGNTSAASVPLALAEAVESNRLKRGDVVVTVGFGAGLTWAANVIRWSR